MQKKKKKKKEKKETGCRDKQRATSGLSARSSVTISVGKRLCPESLPAVWVLEKSRRVAYPRATLATPLDSSSEFGTSHF